MQLFYQPHIAEDQYFLDEEESRHAIKVLRIKKGDSIKITDGMGNLYHALITEVKKQACQFEIINKKSIPKGKHFIHLSIAPTKSMDRMEWMVEKLTEIGIDEISFMRCEYSERNSIKVDRLVKKAIGAIKQSGQVWLPSINAIQDFEKILPFEGSKYIACLDDKKQMSLKTVATGIRHQVLIGPEGDFTQEEIMRAEDSGYQPIGLGNNVLRTETAALVACCQLHSTFDS